MPRARSILRPACLAAAVVTAAMSLPACGAEGEGPGDTAASPEPAAAESTDPPIAGSSSRRQRLASVRNWLYLIDVNLDADTVAEIAASDHDLVVLDLISSELNNTDYPMAEVVATLHDAPRPKIVLAYLDIGEAEDYRTYWQDGWEIGDPQWILGADPDGWEGNYPVAYWDPEWRDIWLEPGGTIADVVEAGFDGIYLDWVEAYSDDTVAAAAGDAGVEPATAMATWVGDLAAAGRGAHPGFLVIAQNAAELAAEDDGYRTILDGLAQEQVWFDGGADNDPPGDCPLPATEDAIDTEDYTESLEGGCRRLYEEFPESTLHVSSEWYLGYLSDIAAANLPVFTVDYAADPANVAWVLAESRRLGFIPFVGERGLDRYVAPR